MTTSMIVAICMMLFMFPAATSAVLNHTRNVKFNHLFNISRTTSKPWLFRKSIAPPTVPPASIMATPFSTKTLAILDFHQKP